MLALGHQLRRPRPITRWTVRSNQPVLGVGDLLVAVAAFAIKPQGPSLALVQALTTSSGASGSRTIGSPM